MRARGLVMPRWLVPLLVAFVGFDLWYLFRTSFEVDGQRIWCLWDDAMISMRYANHLVQGHGLVWNPGEPSVQGYTNLGVTLVMAAVHLLPVSDTNSSLGFQLINLLALVAIAIFSGRIADRLFGGLSGGFATLAVLCSAPLSVWALQGSDAGLMGLWLVLCVARLVGVFVRSENPWITALLFAIGPVLRLDAMVYVAPMWLFLVWSTRALRPAVATFGCVVLAIVAVLTFGVLAYGEPLPNTYYLKTTGAPFALMLERGLESLAAARSLWPLGLLSAAGLVVFRRDSRVMLCGALVVGIAVYNTLVGGDWADEYVSRFMVPALPVLFILCAGVADRLLEQARLRFDRPGALAVSAYALFALLCLAANPSPVWKEWTSVSGAAMWRAGNQQNADLAIRLTALLTPTERVAVHWAGVLPYLRTGPALDVLGKNDAHIARVEMAQPPTRFLPGHSKWDWDYVMAQEPEVVISASRGLKQRPDFLATYRVVIDRRDPAFRFFMRSDLTARVDTERYFVRKVRDQS